MRHHRLAAVRAVMRRNRCTHLLVTDPIDVEYISGFASSRALLLLGRGKKLLFTDFRYAEAARRFCRTRNGWRFVPVADEDAKALAAHVPPKSRVAFQSDALTVEGHGKLTKAMPRVRFVPVAVEISAISASKTPAEAAAVRAAAAVGDAAFARFRRWLRPGVTEREAASALDALCLALGSERGAFDTIVLFGPRTALPHGRPGGRRLKKGDLVLVDFGCTARGFCSDMTRMLVVGRPSARQREIHAIVNRARRAALAAARPGMNASALDAVGRGVIEKAGYGAAFGHGLGHGVGRRIHERPRIGAPSADRLQEGSIITIEPGIYLPKFGGVRIEDLVLLTKRGPRLLTRSPRNLAVV